ncbi:MAG: hypothetical protein K9N62_01855 [Verrucomicrobia bacterium]|nr:hypothetical protein [Verrucomicrobiota bacterium]
MYPRKFLEGYEEMFVQHFLDQYREFGVRASVWSAARFWVHILADTGLSAVREHIHELERKLAMNNPLSRILLLFPTFRRAFAAVFIIGILLTAGVLWVLPNSYAGTALLAVSSHPQTTFDSDFFPKELNRIDSQSILATVVRTLDLTNRWKDRLGPNGSLRPDQAAESLRRRVNTRVNPGTSLVEIRVFDEEPKEAAEIANEIALAYTEELNAAAPTRVADIIDPAAPAVRPMRPNRYLGMALGLLISALAGLGFAILLKAISPSSSGTV